jgi:hypothetical protein
VPDLHGWITQQVNAVEALAREQESSLWQVALGDDSVAAAVLRRCAADRKILERHHLDPDVHFEAACKGCRTYGDQALSWTDDLNDCPELLDLAEAHGLTPEILATLDRPEPPPRPPYPGESGSVIGDSIRSLYADLYKALLASTTAEAERLVTGDGTGAPLGFLAMADVPEPTPGERAFAILDPHLTDVPLYRTEWKARP